jgi:hypothetical protein
MLTSVLRWTRSMTSALLVEPAVLVLAEAEQPLAGYARKLWVSR